TSGAPTFRELLRRVRRTTLDAHAHQAMPFRTVVEVVRPKREPGRSPLFQVMFTYSSTDTGQDTGALPGVTATREQLELPVARFDLVLNVVEHQNGTTGALEYNSDLFHAETVEAAGRRYRDLLAEIVAHPERPLQ